MNNNISVKSFCYSDISAAAGISNVFFKSLLEQDAIDVK